MNFREQYEKEKNLKMEQKITDCFGNYLTIVDYAYIEYLEKRLKEEIEKG